MKTDLQPQEVRALVTRTFEELGARIQASSDLDETILIDSGKHAARSYKMDGLMAMWLIEVGLIQFYDAEGNMLRTINLFQELVPLKMAA